MQIDIQFIVLYGSAALAAGIIGYTLTGRYLGLAGYGNSVQTGSLKDLIAPLGALISAKSAEIPAFAEKVREYEKKLRQAGRFWGGLTPCEILAVKFVIPPVLAAGILFTGIICGIPLDIVALCAIFFMITGYLYPDSALDAAAKERCALFMKQLPGGLDILKVAAESGLDFLSSVNYIVDIYIPGPFKEEMRIFQRDLKLGVPAVQALVNIAERMNVPEATTIFISLSQSIEMGTSIVDMLESTTKELRRKRLLAAEAEAQKAVVKITFPLLLLILPGIFIVLLAPVLKPMMAVFSNFAQ